MTECSFPPEEGQQIMECQAVPCPGGLGVPQELAGIC